RPPVAIARGVAAVAVGVGVGAVALALADRVRPAIALSRDAVGALVAAPLDLPRGLFAAAVDLAGLLPVALPRRRRRCAVAPAFDLARRAFAATVDPRRALLRPALDALSPLLWVRLLALLRPLRHLL